MNLCCSTGTVTACLGVYLWKSGPIVIYVLHLKGQLYEAVKQDIFSVQSKPNILGDNTLFLITYFRRNTCTGKMRLHLLILLLKLNIFQWFLILSSLLGACDIRFLAVKNIRSILVIIDVCCSCFFLLHHLYLIGCTCHIYKFQPKNFRIPSIL